MRLCIWFVSIIRNIRQNSKLGYTAMLVVTVTEVKVTLYNDHDDVLTRCATQRQLRSKKCDLHIFFGILTVSHCLHKFTVTHASLYFVYIELWSDGYMLQERLREEERIRQLEEEEARRRQAELEKYKDAEKVLEVGYSSFSLDFCDKLNRKVKYVFSIYGAFIARLKVTQQISCKDPSGYLWIKFNDFFMSTKCKWNLLFQVSEI